MEDSLRSPADRQLEISGPARSNQSELFRPRHSVRTLAGGELAGGRHRLEIYDCNPVIRTYRHKSPRSIRRNQNAGAALSKVDAFNLFPRLRIEKYEITRAEIGNQHCPSIRSEFQTVGGFAGHA